MPDVRVLFTYAWHHANKLKCWKVSFYRVVQISTKSAVYCLKVRESGKWLKQFGVYTYSRYKLSRNMNSYLIFFRLRLRSAWTQCFGPITSITSARRASRRMFNCCALIARSVSTTSPIPSELLANSSRRRSPSKCCQLLRHVRTFLPIYPLACRTKTPKRNQKHASG